MSGKNDQQNVFTRRALLLAGGKLVLVGGIVARLYQLQVIENRRYALLADKNRIQSKPIAPARGRVLDRFGEVLADNRPDYRVVLEADSVPDPDLSLGRVAALIDLPQAQRTAVAERLARKRERKAVVVRADLTWNELALIEANNLDLPGVLIDPAQRRVYPFGATAGHLTGYVGEPTAEDLSSGQGVPIPASMVGRAGMERLWEDRLYGQPGLRTVEVSAGGREVRDLDLRKPEAGLDVESTLDIGLQETLSRRLSGERSAAGAVLDVHSGEVLAIASLPAYDPNLFVGGIEAGEWRRLTSDPGRPLLDKSISGEFAPGSTFKMVVALAALEAGTTTPERRIFCSGTFRLGNAVFHCWKRGGHGSVDLTAAIEQSCDVYFYQTALAVGVDAISAMARRFGLGEVTGIGLPGEKAGFLPTTGWKAATFAEPWQKGETVVTGIGQGYVNATPLQLAVMTARLVNGGRAVRPTLDRASGAQGRPPAEPIGVASRWLELIRNAMDRVTNSRKGTAYRARIEQAGYEMGGKTGTSQVRRITMAERRSGVVANEDLPWERRDHALFVGFAPADAPQYAAAVVVEHGGGGSAVAAPIVRDVLLTAQRRGSAGSAPHDHLLANRQDETRHG